MYGILVLLGVVVIVFFLFNVLPGDPARLMLGNHANKAGIEMINRDLGLDQPVGRQFLLYLNDLSPVSFHNTTDNTNIFYLDSTKYDANVLFSTGAEQVCVLKAPYLRRSYHTKRKVSDLIFDALPETAVLALASILLATLLGIFLGILAALRKGTWVDNFALVFSAIGMSGPSFFVALIFAWLFGFVWSDFTGLNHHGSLFEFDDFGNEYLALQNLILPALTLGIRPLAVVVQLTRSSMLDVMRTDYVRTARAKGLGFYKIVVKHALKNALNPVVTAISGMFAGLMAGAVFIEIIFDWQGIGNELVTALQKQDLPIVMGIVLIITTVFVVINIIVDLAYGFLDPRVRVQ